MPAHSLVSLLVCTSVATGIAFATPNIYFDVTIQVDSVWSGATAVPGQTASFQIPAETRGWDRSLELQCTYNFGVVPDGFPVIPGTGPGWCEEDPDGSIRFLPFGIHSFDLPGLLFGSSVPVEGQNPDVFVFWIEPGVGLTRFFYTWGIPVVAWEPKTPLNIVAPACCAWEGSVVGSPQVTIVPEGSAFALAALGLAVGVFIANGKARRG
jgi:hypothetical protein